MRKSIFKQVLKNSAVIFYFSILSLSGNASTWGFNLFNSHVEIKKALVTSDNFIYALVNSKTGGTTNTVFSNAVLLCDTSGVLKAIINLPDSIIATDMCLSTLGDVFVTGSVFSTSAFGTTTLNPVNGNIFVCRINRIFVSPAFSLSFAWAVNQPGTIGNAIDDDPGSGRVVVTGNANGNFKLFSLNSSNGILVWNFTTVLSNTNGLSVDAHASGIAVSGSTNNDMFVSKFSLSGGLVWTATVAGLKQEFSKSVGIDASGNIFAGGYADSAAVVFNATGVASDIINGLTQRVFVVKYSSAGAFINTSKYGVSDTAMISHLVCSGLSVNLCGNFKTSISNPVSGVISTASGDGVFYSVIGAPGSSTTVAVVAGKFEAHSICRNQAVNFFISNARISYNSQSFKQTVYTSEIRKISGSSIASTFFQLSPDSHAANISDLTRDLKGFTYVVFHNIFAGLDIDPGPGYYYIKSKSVLAVYDSTGLLMGGIPVPGDAEDVTIADSPSGAIAIYVSGQSTGIDVGLCGIPSFGGSTDIYSNSYSMVASGSFPSFNLACTGSVKRVTSPSADEANNNIFFKGNVINAGDSAGLFYLNSTGVNNWTYTGTVGKFMSVDTMGSFLYAAGTGVLMKFSITGTLLWTIATSGINDGLKTDLAGNILVGGFSSTLITVFDRLGAAQGTISGNYLLKYDSNGNFIWKINSIQVAEIGIDINNNVYVVGNSTSVVRIHRSDGTLLETVTISASNVSLLGLFAKKQKGFVTGGNNLTGNALLTFPGDTSIFINGPFASPLVINYDPKKASPLPVELLTYNARVSDNTTVLNSWTTASETNNDYFTIERSKDGIHFEIAGTVDGAGNSKETLDYSFQDAHPFKGTSYYRLKQTDFNGGFTYSKVVKVQFNNENLTITKIYPNPARESFTAEYATENSEIVMITLVDISGKTIQSESFLSSGGLNSQRIDVGNMEQGYYLVEIRSGEYNKCMQLIVE